MNDIEIALEDLDTLVEIARQHTGIASWLGLVHSALMMKEALEKQIAKKPSEQSYNQSFMDEGIDDGVEYLCPNCKSIVGAYSNSLEDWLGQQKHCEDCGQKIDWEVENE